MIYITVNIAIRRIAANIINKYVVIFSSEIKGKSSPPNSIYNIENKNIIKISYMKAESTSSLDSNFFMCKSAIWQIFLNKNINKNIVNK